MTIAEVSKKYGLTQDTIRYYERIGLIPTIPRTQNGIRNFDEESCRWIEFIKCMRNAGMEIEILLQYVELKWYSKVATPCTFKYNKNVRRSSHVKETLHKRFQDRSRKRIYEREYVSSY